MSTDDPIRSAGPQSPLGCREALRRALGAVLPLAPEVAAHLASCAFCAARQRAALRLAALLRQRPATPSALTAEAVSERIVAAAEAAPLGEALAKALPRVQPVGDHAWPQELLESPLGRATLQPPTPPTAAAWATVRESIWREVSAAPASTGRPAVRRFGLALAGAAAVAVAAVLIQSPAGDRAEPEIVFTDLVAPPAVDFAVLRHGIAGESR